MRGKVEKGVGIGHAQTCLVVDILKVIQQGAALNLYGADTDWGVLDGVHIGVTWRILMNRPYAVAIRP